MKGQLDYGPSTYIKMGATPCMTKESACEYLYGKIRSMAPLESCQGCAFTTVLVVVCSIFRCQQLHRPCTYRMNCCRAFLYAHGATQHLCLTTVLSIIASIHLNTRPAFYSASHSHVGALVVCLSRAGAHMLLGRPRSQGWFYPTWPPTHTPASGFH